MTYNPTLHKLADRIERGYMKAEERRTVALIVYWAEQLTDAAEGHHDEQCDFDIDRRERDCALCQTRQALVDLIDIGRACGEIPTIPEKKEP